MRGVLQSPLTDSNRPPPPMQVSERHARTRAIAYDTVLPGNQAIPSASDATRDVARVVSDVSVLCPRIVGDLDNVFWRNLAGSIDRSGFALFRRLRGWASCQLIAIGCARWAR